MRKKLLTTLWVLFIGASTYSHHRVLSSNLLGVLESTVFISEGYSFENRAEPFYMHEGKEGEISLPYRTQLDSVEISISLQEEIRNSILPYLHQYYDCPSDYAIAISFIELFSNKYLQVSLKNISAGVFSNEACGYCFVDSVLCVIDSYEDYPHIKKANGTPYHISCKESNNSERYSFWLYEYTEQELTLAEFRSRNWIFQTRTPKEHQQTKHQSDIRLRYVELASYIQEAILHSIIPYAVSQKLNNKIDGFYISFSDHRMSVLQWDTYDNVTLRKAQYYSVINNYLFIIEAGTPSQNFKMIQGKDRTYPINSDIVSGWDTGGYWEYKIEDGKLEPLRIAFLPW